MRKNRELAIQLLRKKENVSYKEISKETGYHEKSLVRMRKLLRTNEYTSINRNISLEEQEYIINLYSRKLFNSIKEFYKYYSNNQNNFNIRSYSTIYKLLVRENKVYKELYEGDILIIGNIVNNKVFTRFYYAYDYKSSSLIYLKESYGDPFINYLNMIKEITEGYGIPIKIKCIGNSFLKNVNYNKSKLFFYNCFNNGIDIEKAYNNYFKRIKVIIEKKVLNKEIEVMSHNLKSLNNKVREVNDFIINIVYRKNIGNNIIQHKNRLYKILIEEEIPLFETIEVLTILNNRTPIIIYRNNKYKVKIINLKESKKKYSIW